MYTLNKIQGFWDGNLFNAASGTALKNFRKIFQYTPLTRKEQMILATTLQKLGSLSIKWFQQDTSKTNS